VQHERKIAATYAWSASHAAIMACSLTASSIAQSQYVVICHTDAVSE
jgi:hypothetical protein